MPALRRHCSGVEFEWQRGEKDPVVFPASGATHVNPDGEFVVLFKGKRFPVVRD